MELGLAGRVALVGGATQGIGRAIATALVSEGAEVVITARDPQRTAAVAAEIGARAGLAHDGGDADGVPALLERVNCVAGPVDVLVLNTGGPPVGADPLGFSETAWSEAHRTLVLGPLALVRSVLPGMRARRFGRVVSVASTSVVEPIPTLMLSNAERSAQRAALKTLARAAAGDGVTINTLLTGRIATERSVQTAGSPERAQAAAAAEVPAGRLGTPEEMAAAAVFLCSAPAAYITGVSLPVDGGLLRSV